MSLLARISLLLLTLLPLAGNAAGTWVGTGAPDIRLPDQDNKPHSLADYKGRWVALYFYPKDDTPGCTQEARQFRDRWPRFQKAGIEVIGVSLDSVASHKSFATTQNLPFVLLSDEKHQLAKAMGVLRGFGPVAYTSRETFLVDPSGTIVYHYPSVNTAQHAEEVLADVARLRQKN